ncbi:MAG: DUF1629 domain-containing protein [Hyphomicrobium sp.]
MAYMIFTSTDDRDNLSYRLEGGNPKQPTIDRVAPDGTPRNGQSISGCFMDSMRVPSPLLVSVPKRIIIKPWRGGFIADFAKASDYMTYIVSDRFVDIVERLEPGAHEFLPIAETVDNKGQPIARRFFLLNVLTRLACIDVERSTVEWKDTSFEFQGKWIESIMLNIKPGVINQQKFVAIRDVIKGHHLWRGNKEGLLGQYYCSNRLHDEMRTAGLSPFWFIPMDES